MGSRGIGTFEDELATEWLEAAEHTGAVPALLRALTLPEEGYLERSIGAAVLAAAEIIAGTVSGPRYGLPQRAVRLIASLEAEEVAPLRALAARQARRVLGAHSELREYWDESDLEFPRWRASVLELCRRLDE